MRFHVVGLPFEPQPQCAYHGKVVRFVKMMVEAGHEVFEHQAPAELWDHARAFDPGSESWRTWNAQAVARLAKTVAPTDFICVIAGLCQKPIADAFPHHMTVEFGIGYGGTFAQYRVFESYAWMHTVYGAQGGSNADGRFYDAVIPNYFDTDEFPAGEGGEGYAFVGRLIDRKGYRIAADVCKHLGAPLTIAGEGTPPSYGDYVGVVGPERRAEIMGSARAVFVPTLYIEPFGGVAVEAMLCGTPVITTDWGAFTETVEHGVTGFRCRTLQEFVDAALLAENLDRDEIRAKAQHRFSLKTVGSQYERYFERLSAVWTGGWPTLASRYPK